MKPITGTMHARVQACDLQPSHREVLLMRGRVLVVVLIAGLIGAAVGTSDVLMTRIISGATLGLCIGICLCDRS